MKQIVAGFGLLILCLLILFRLADYAMFRWNNNLATWIALFSVLFLAIGIIISRKLFKKEVIHVREIIVEAPAPAEIDHKQADRIGLSKREYEVLKLIHDGLSNQQIGEKLFVSENTVKKHISSIFLKMDVERRTEAVKKAKTLRLI